MPRTVNGTGHSPLRRVALRDAMRALSCVPHAIAATFEDTAADLAQERHGADDATMARRWNPVDSWPFCLARGFVVSVVFLASRTPAADKTPFDEISCASVSHLAS